MDREGGREMLTELLVVDDFATRVLSSPSSLLDQGLLELENSGSRNWISEKCHAL